SAGPPNLDLAAARAAWSAYAAGPAFLDRLAAGESPRAVWSAVPGERWADALAHAVAATLASGRGSAACSPDQRYVGRLARAPPLTAGRSVGREGGPAVSVTGATGTDLDRDPSARIARLPGAVFHAARAALDHGPVLFQVPRHGYLTALACEQCRQRARCQVC